MAGRVECNDMGKKKSVMHFWQAQPLASKDVEKQMVVKATSLADAGLYEKDEVATYELDTTNAIEEENNTKRCTRAVKAANPN